MVYYILNVVFNAVLDTYAMIGGVISIIVDFLDFDRSQKMFLMSCYVLCHTK